MKRKPKFKIDDEVEIISKPLTVTKVELVSCQTPYYQYQLSNGQWMFENEIRETRQ